MGRLGTGGTEIVLNRKDKRRPRSWNRFIDKYPHKIPPERLIVEQPYEWYEL